jgi:hypothetical protein
VAHLSSDFPVRRVVEEALGIYAATPFKRIWPVIDAVLFQRTIAAAYDERGGCSSAAARACIFALLSLLALHHMYPPSMPSLDSEECAVQAQYLLPLVLHETNLDGLQTCFMLVSTPLSRVFSSLLLLDPFRLPSHASLSPASSFPASPSCRSN